MTTNENNQEKSTSEAFSLLWSKLNPNQQRFAVAMLQCKTKKEAAELIDIEPNTAYKWGDEINVVVDFMRNNISAAALGIIEANATKAAMIKSRGLDSDNEKIRQDVATEILDRHLGKPTQSNVIKGDKDSPLSIRFVDYGLELDDDDTD